MSSKRAMSRPYAAEASVSADEFFSGEPNAMIEWMTQAVQATMKSVSEQMVEAGAEPMGSPQIRLVFEAQGKIK